MVIPSYWYRPQRAHGESGAGSSCCIQAIQTPLWKYQQWMAPFRHAPSCRIQTHGLLASTRWEPVG